MDNLLSPFLHYSTNWFLTYAIYFSVNSLSSFHFKCMSINAWKRDKRKSLGKSLCFSFTSNYCLIWIGCKASERVKQRMWWVLDCTAMWCPQPGAPGTTLVEIMKNNNLFILMACHGGEIWILTLPFKLLCLFVNDEYAVREQILKCHKTIMGSWKIIKTQ